MSPMHRLMVQINHELTAEHERLRGHTPSDYYSWSDLEGCGSALDRQGWRERKASIAQDAQQQQSYREANGQQLEADRQAAGRQLEASRQMQP